MWRENCTVTDCNFNGNTAKTTGGAISWSGANSTMFNCNFTNNHAPYGDNVYWYWTVEEFLNKYGQINDYDYVYIRNGVGTPSSTIILNKKGVTISGQSTNVIFDAKGGNLHFEVTGDNVLIENLSFRNFNFTNGSGGAILWQGNNGILKNCNFINNTVNGGGGAVLWMWNVINGTLISCTFIDNSASRYGGAVYWDSANGIITDSTFINNTAIIGGGIYWQGRDGSLTNSTFINNTATDSGGGVRCSGANGIIMESIFIGNNAIKYGGGVSYDSVNGIIRGSNFRNNAAGINGGAINWNGANGHLIDSTFINNVANNLGGGICWIGANGNIINCCFANGNWINNKSKSNGIYSLNSLDINGGNGIVDIVTQSTLSGISIVVLNNETYYYPPDTNINFI